MVPLSQNSLDLFKQLHPQDTRLQNLTLEELLRNTSPTPPNFADACRAAPLYAEPVDLDPVYTPDERALAIGMVVIDIVLLLLDASSLREAIQANTVKAVTKQLVPVMSRLERRLAALAARESKKDIARGILEILGDLWAVDCVGGVAAEIMRGLTWYEYVLYGANIIATIAAAIGTGGVAIAGQLAVTLVSAAFLTRDLIHAVEVFRNFTPLPETDASNARVLVSRVCQISDPEGDSLSVASHTSRWKTLAEGRARNVHEMFFSTPESRVYQLTQRTTGTGFYEADEIYPGEYATKLASDEGITEGHLFLIGKDQNLWVRRRLGRFPLQNNGKYVEWSPAIRLTTEGCFAQVASMRQAFDTHEVFLVSTGGHLHRLVLRDDLTIQTARDCINYDITFKQIALVVNDEGRTELFAAGKDGKLYRMTQSQPCTANLNTWSSPSVVSPTPYKYFNYNNSTTTPLQTVHRLCAARSTNGKLEVYVLMTDGQLWRYSQVEAGSGAFFNSPSPMLAADFHYTSNPVFSQIDVARNLDGRLELFLVGANQQLHHMTQDGSLNWSAPTKVVGGDQMVVRMSAGSNYDGTLHVMYLAPGNIPCHTWQTRVNDSGSYLSEPLPYQRQPELAFTGTVAIQVPTGHFLSFNPDGSNGQENVAIQTNRTRPDAWEHFTVVPIEAARQTFALKTYDGHFVTAVNGGGVGGPNDATCPVHSDAVAPYAWERLNFERVGKFTYAIRTSNGHYLTAADRGGKGGNRVLNTDQTGLGPWETFTLARDPFWTIWQSLGGVARSKSGALSRAGGQIETYHWGTDNGAWRRVGDGNSWGPWESLGGSITSAPTASTWGENRLDVFARGSDNSLWHRPFDGQWRAWESLGGNIIGGAGAASWGPNRIDVFVRAVDNCLWRRGWNGTSWSPWESLGGGQLTSPPTVVSCGANRLKVFVRAGDDRLWYRAWDGSQWSPWETLGGILQGDPTAVTWSPNHIDVFYPTLNGRIGRRTWNGSEWLPESFPFGTATICTGDAGIALATRGPGRLTCFLSGYGTDIRLSNL